MAKTTIKDLSLAAGLSVATINRVLAGAENVRPATRQLVQDAAERIGFYGLGAITGRVAAARPKLRFGVQLLQPHRPFYQLLAQHLREAALACTEADIDLVIDHLEDLSPQITAQRARALAQNCHAVSITSAVHPLVSEAIADIQAMDVSVFALISQLATAGTVHYVGLDNWKAGRMAAWMMHQCAENAGNIGILMGNFRYRNQEMNEAGFRSYFREHAPEFTLLEPLPTFESAAVAEEMTEKLLQAHENLVGLFVAGGGISGALTALRSRVNPHGKMVVAGFDLMDTTRAALMDGSMDFVIAHPIAQLAQSLISGMQRAANPRTAKANHSTIVPFQIFSRENL